MQLGWECYTCSRIATAQKRLKLWQILAIALFLTENNIFKVRCKNSNKSQRIFANY